MGKSKIDTTSNATPKKPRRVDADFITSILENYKMFLDLGLSDEEIKIKNPDHPLTKFVQENGRQFEFTRETGKKGVIRINGSNATS